ncbi:MAG: DUF3488 and DUF4129 domain-containing transglutaminase family protein [Lautropia sp.]
MTDRDPVTGRPAAPGGRRVLGISVRALGGRLGTVWERDRRDTLFLMGAVLLSALPQMFYLPAWCSIGFFILFVWRLGLIFSGRPLPGTLVRLIAAIAIIGAVFAQFHSLFGRDPGVALLVLFLGLKLMEMRARRDLFVVIFLCCFLLLTGYFHSQGIWMAAATLVAVLTLVASMLTMQFRQEEIPIRRRLRYAAVLLLQAIPVAAALFVLFPRPNGPLWGNPEDAAGGRTGLSDSMAPGDFSNLAESDDVVMRVRFDGAEPEPARMYWRGPTFGHFDGRIWRPTRFGAPPPTEIDIPPGGQSYRYTATLEPATHRWLLALDLPVAMPAIAGVRVGIAPTFELIAEESHGERLRYDGEARFDAKIGRNENAASRNRWLALPNRFNPRTRELAERWLADGDASVPALIRRTLDWIRHEPFSYTLSPPLLGRDSVDEFLFDTRAGFCEHFAGAFVVLMRMLGVPARVVTGYQGAEHNPRDGYWIVRQSNAHAWAEVWSEPDGWIRVDPTGAVAPERIERGTLQARRGAGSAIADTGRQWWHDWRLSFDGLTHAWNQWVLTYDKSRQRSLLARFGLDMTDWQEVAGALAGVLALLLGGIALLTLRPNRLRDPIERQYDEFCQRLAAVGAERFPYETPNGYLIRIERLLDDRAGAQARAIVAAVNRMRYDDDRAARDSLAQLQRMVRAFDP